MSSEEASAEGERDLATLLVGLEVRRRRGEFLYCTQPLGAPLPDAGVEALVAEEDGVTLIMRADHADEAGLDGVFRCAWLTIAAHSALDGVGLIATVASALAALDIPCNVLAGYRHDHLLVPVDRADDAIAAIADVRERARRGNDGG